jgi:hypothetical protein
MLTGGRKIKQSMNLLLELVRIVIRLLEKNNAIEQVIAYLL